MNSNILNHILIAVPLLLFCSAHLQAQQEISASDVYYTRVDSVYPTKDTVKVSSLSSFEVGDKVLIMQMTGAKFLYDPPESGIIQFYNQTGVYEIISIKSVDVVNNLIVFIDALSRDFDAGESIQLAKVAERNIGVINNNINVQDWNGETGGIFPILTYSKLVLNAEIDASGAGFRGADPTTDPDYTGSCTSDDTKYFHTDSAHKAGLKGESFITSSFKYNRGIGRVVNGGGGTNGLFGGGGGGANYGLGNAGGKQSTLCSNLTANGGKTELTIFYTPESNKVTFGGGGGASTRDDQHEATKGGDGGGVILILTDTLEVNGGKLVAKGEDVTGIATAGGGGGGGGGTLLLDASSIKGNLQVDVSGGKGGSVQQTDVCTGAGGGGGGGVMWYSGQDYPVAVQVDTAGGEPGDIEATCINNLGFDGKPGDAIGSLRLPLTGFLFNFITGTDTICAGQVPDTIRASMPRGGDGTFNYIWQYSLDSVNWDNYPSDPEDSLLFTTNPLDTTTYFRRVVTSAGDYDTSRFVKIFVWPAIENNEIGDNQTLCYLQKAEILTGEQPTGGDDNFFYRWEKSLDETSWQAIDSSTANNSLAPGKLTDTTYYRRYVKSVKVCTSYSNTVDIIVQPALKGIGIEDNQEECYGYIPEPLTGTGTVSGGDHQIYYYFWQFNPESESWTCTGNDTTSSDFQPDPLTDTTMFRRIVKSGVCVDTSNNVTINVQPPIGNNQIFEYHKICYGETSPELYDNGTLTGGNHSEYIKIWQKSIDQSSWIEPEKNASEDFSPGQLFENTYFRRVISSGACFDTSNIVEIEVVPEIINILSSSDTTICYGFTPAPFLETIASGGYGNFVYQWQRKPLEEESWNTAPNEATQFSYIPLELTQSVQYRRAVTSDICTDFSDTVVVTVLPSISSNLITEAPLTYTCYNIPKKLEATTPAGGEEGQYAYTWEKSTAGESWVMSENQNTDRNYITPALTDSMLYRRLVFSGEHNQCKDTSDVVLIRIHQLPTGNIISAYDTAVCDREELTVDLELTGQSPWKVYLNDGFSDTLPNANDQIMISYLETNIREDHTLAFDSIVDAHNCRATDMEGSVQVTSVEVPEPEIITADDVCENTAEIEAGKAKFLSYWSSDYATFEDSTHHQTEAYALRFDTVNVIKWTEVNDICSTTAVDSITFFRQPDEAGIPPDTILYNTFVIELATDNPSFGEVQWKVLEDNASILQQTDSYTQVSFQQDEFNEEYHIVYEIENGECLQSDTMLVIVKDVTIPNAFSPNGDGINDYFYIEGIEDLETSELFIFNSWGNMVRHYPDYRMSFETENRLWDGTDENGEDLPEGTYYYILNMGEQKQPDKGFIILRRSASTR